MIKRYHVCEVLKDFTRDLYYYENKDWLNSVFLYLDYVLICNQHITNVFTHILQKELTPEIFYEKYPIGLFPAFLQEYDKEIIKNNVDEINNEIDNIKPKKAVLLDEVVFYNDLTLLSKFELLNLKTPYTEIISILRYENDPMIERAEYGYYIGSLLKISTDLFLEKHDVNSDVWHGTEPNWKIFSNRISNYRKDVFSLEGQRC